jgi:hypothetical protein
MNTHETGTEKPAHGKPPSPNGGDLCGGPSLPKCPDPLVYQERNALIYQIAGTRTDPERVREATERVDAYLVGALRDALALTAPLGHRR